MIFKLASYQLLIVSNFKSFTSCTILLNIMIIFSHLDESFIVVVHVDLPNSVFLFSNDALNLSDLLVLTKFMALTEAKISSCLARLPITKCESKCLQIMPLHLTDSQLHYFFNALLSKIFHVWDFYHACDFLNCFFSNNQFALS